MALPGHKALTALDLDHFPTENVPPSDEHDMHKFGGTRAVHRLCLIGVPGWDVDMATVRAFTTEPIACKSLQRLGAQADPYRGLHTYVKERLDIDVLHITLSPTRALIAAPEAIHTRTARLQTRGYCLLVAINESLNQLPAHQCTPDNVLGHIVLSPGLHDWHEPRFLCDCQDLVLRRLARYRYRGFTLSTQWDDQIIPAQPARAPFEFLAGDSEQEAADEADGYFP